MYKDYIKCSRKINNPHAPKKSTFLISGTCECVNLNGKGDFADVIKGLERRTQCHPKNPYKGEVEESEPEEGMSWCKDSAGRQEMQAVSRS